MRIRHKIGDIFEVSIGDGTVGYFQYVAVDGSQLSSAVIRAFAGRFSAENPPSIDEIVDLDAHFYAHVFLKTGYVQNLWRKIGTAPASFDADIFFRCSADFGNPEVKISHDWYVWRINQSYMNV